MEKFPPAACTKFSSSHRQASTTPLFDVVFPNISTWKLFKTSPLDSNLGHHTYIRVYEIKLELPAPAPARARVTKSNPCFHFTVIL